MRHALALLAAAALLMAVPALASAAPRPSLADLAVGDLSQFDQTNEHVGSLRVVDDGYGDDTSARAIYAGGGQNGFARGIWNVDWENGDNVWYGSAFYLPEGFHASMQGQVALMRWDDWPSHPVDRASGGIVIWGSDKRARLVRELLPGGNQTGLSDPFVLPEGRWFWLEVHQRLSAGRGAVNEIFLDGRRIDRSTARNNFRGRRAERIRYGIVAIAAGEQRRSLRLRFDRSTVTRQRVGPLSAAAR